MDSDYYDTDYATEAPLPTPRGTPYDRSPLPSRHSSRGPSPFANVNPAPGLNLSQNRWSNSQHHHHDGAFDENISILDPRRFTPTLHANLVAEILSLRRELESKGHLVESLENDVDQARVEQEAAAASVAAALKEAREVKRQLARAESDDAVVAVALERDEAVEALVELKKQVERLSKSRRAAEDDLEQLRKTAERDLEKYAEAKRGFERRAHVAEGRLKAVMDELAVAEVMRQRPVSLQRHVSLRSHQRIMSEDYGDFQSDTASVRSSVMSMRRRPTSLMMGDDEAEKLGISLHSPLRTNGNSLADELNFDESEEDEALSGNETEIELEEPADMLSDVESLPDIDELPEMDELVEIGVQVVPDVDYEVRCHELEELLEEKTTELETTYATLDQKTTDMEDLYAILDKANQEVAEAEDKCALITEQGQELKKDIEERQRQIEKRVTDFENMQEEHDLEIEAHLQELEKKKAGIEAEKSVIQELSTSVKEEQEMVNQNKLEFECELRRRQELKSEIEKEIKRLEEQKSMVEMPPRSAEAVSTEPAPVYVSTESQTQTDDISLPTIVLEDTTEKLFQTIGTQTDPMKPSIIRVPAIMVSPPEPTPPLPKPAMKSISVQTRPLRVRTRSMQTEEIRLDERLKRFAHLLPSALIPKVAPAEPERVPPSPPHPPRKSSKRTIRRSSTEPTPVEDSPPAKPYTTSDMGVGTSSPPSMTEVSHKRKSFRPKNILYSIDMSHNQEVVSSGDDYFQEEGDSGSEYQTVLSAPKPRGKQRANTLPVIPHSFASTASDAGSELSRRQPSIRRGAMVTSGMQAHGRPRSPSMAMSESGVTKVGPPFPVPARQSSRRPNYMSDRDMTGSPTSTRLIRKTSGPRPPRPKSVRKARSATTIRNSIGDDDRARSPPPLSVSSTAPDSPRSLPPPMPRDEILSPAFERHGFGQGTSRHRHQPSNNTSNTAESLLQQTSVVDAIAQTMIGEWMWKYVRRRRTFGAADPPLEDDTAGGQRHKRWVWLAPYERAVMWSSRQPTSGSALLGKSGRKRKRTILHPLGGPDLDDTISCVMDRVLTKKVLIQSVLDVKDDTPLPKGATQPVFNRSILILTPARALKFTAPTKERHYVWLTALSFLSHATDSGEGNISLPPPLPFEYEQVERQFRPKPPPVPRAAPARISAFSTTRDSVRLAKGKGRAGHPASPPPNISMTGYPGSGGVYGPGSHGGGGGSGTYPMNIATSPITRGATMSQETLSAEPPSIPRFPGTSRRRSNTNMRRPQTRSTSHGYERSLASYATSNTGSTIGGGSEEFYNVGVGGVGLTSANSSIVHGFGGNGGWEAGPMGTMRMEAFVDRRPRYERFEDSGSVAQRRRSRQDSFWGGGAGSRSSQFYGDEEDYDPFRGF